MIFSRFAFKILKSEAIGKRGITCRSCAQQHVEPPDENSHSEYFLSLFGREGVGAFWDNSKVNELQA